MINSVGAGLPNPEITIATLDLAAQQSMAWWTRATFFTSLVSVALSAVALVGILISLRQTARTIKDARISSELQNQAYAYVSGLEYGNRSPLIATCKNTGLTPATHFSIAATAQIVKLGGISASATFENHDFKTWTRLGPGEETTVALAVENSELVRQFFNHTFAKDEALLICGTLIYCTIYNHDHETQFMFYAERDNRTRFRRPTANLLSFHRIKDPARNYEHSPTPWQEY